MGNNAIFDIRDVSRKFGDDPDTEIWALKNINLKIHKGEFTALIGSGDILIFSPFIRGMDVAPSLAMLPGRGLLGNDAHGY